MKLRKAKKDHTCLLCNNPIAKGINYIYARVTPWDHPENEYFFDHKAHVKCQLVWNENGHHWDWEYPTSDPWFFREILEEYELTTRKVVRALRRYK